MPAICWLNFVASLSSSSILNLGTIVRGVCVYGVCYSLMMVCGENNTTLWPHTLAWICELHD